MKVVILTNDEGKALVLCQMVVVDIVSSKCEWGIGLDTSLCKGKRREAVQIRCTSTDKMAVVNEDRIRNKCR